MLIDCNNTEDLNKAQMLGSQMQGGGRSILVEILKNMHMVVLHTTALQFIPVKENRSVYAKGCTYWFVWMKILLIGKHSILRALGTLHWSRTWVSSYSFDMFAENAWQKLQQASPTEKYARYFCCKLGRNEIWNKIEQGNEIEQVFQSYALTF